MPIRVLHVLASMNRGGAESIIMNLYRTIDRTRIQFDFVECTTEKAAYDNEINALGGTIFHCPPLSYANISTYKKWWNEFFNEHALDYAIVHGHIGSSAAIYLGEAKKHGIYTIAHSHNTNNTHSIGQILYNMAAYPTRFIADAFFACSRQAGIDRYGRKVGEKCIVFNNAIDTEKYMFSQKTREIIRRELGIPDNCFVIGHVGRFNEQKNHKFLLDVFAKTVARNEQARLLLVGDGILRNEIEKQIDALGINDKVVMTGVRSDVEMVLQAMDCFVFPSVFEGFGMVVLEAQASGLFCIVSDAIQDEVIMDEDKVVQLRLSDGVAAWSKEVLQHTNERRYNCRPIISTKGFDIRTAAAWLQDYYLAHSNTL